MAETFEELAITLNIEHQECKIAFKESKVNLKKDNNRASVRHYRLILKQLRASKERLNPRHAHSTRMSCKHAGELNGSSSFKGKQILDRMIAKKIIRREIVLDYDIKQVSSLEEARQRINYYKSSGQPFIFDYQAGRFFKKNIAVCLMIVGRSLEEGITIKTPRPESPTLQKIEEKYRLLNIKEALL